MCELEEALAHLLKEQPSRLVFSAPRNPDDGRTELQRGSSGWKMTRMRGTQAFHSHPSNGELPDVLAGLLRENYTQLTAFTCAAEHRLRLTKKGKLLASKSALQKKTTPKDSFLEVVADGFPQANDKADAPKLAHNRQKDYLLAEGQPIPPLVDMGVFTAGGQVVQRMYDKYRQVNRFVEIVDDALRGEEKKHLRIIDFGCGKSYLTFVLYHYLTEVRHFSLEMIGLDLKREVVAHCAEAAARYGYSGLRFECGDIAGFNVDGPVDMVLCLHACDTATDKALAQAIRWQARRIFAVPCCQHELNAQIHSEALPLFTRYGIIQERISAAITDAIRANLLYACGYKSQILEFIGMESTPKNLLLRAVNTGQPEKVRRQALEEVHALCHTFGLRPTLLEDLSGLLPE